MLIIANQSNKFSHRQSNYGDCLYFLIGSDNERKLIDKIIPVLNNSKVRSRAHWKADRNFSGEMRSLSGRLTSKLCPFKLKK